MVLPYPRCFLLFLRGKSTQQLDLITSFLKLIASSQLSVKNLDLNVGLLGWGRIVTACIAPNVRFLSDSTHKILMSPPAWKSSPQ